MEFQPDLNEQKIIKVIGVGGGGSNAVNYMHKQGVEGVDFHICNTDIQALRNSSVPNRVQLGSDGLGAGSSPEAGEEAAKGSIEEIESMLSDGTRMIFITAGFGGGTGTGAAPVIASVAKKLGILTVGIITIPFGHEGPLRRKQAEEGIEKMKPHVDALLTISNDRIVEMYGDMTFMEAFSEADSILCTAARGIADIIFTPGHINVDFNDVRTAMKESGHALLGTGVADGENRAENAAKNALESPLLNNNKITGAKHLLINLCYGNAMPTMAEMGKISQFLQEQAGNSADLKMGITQNDDLGECLSVTVIATGFKTAEEYSEEISKIESNEEISKEPISEDEFEIEDMEELQDETENPYSPKGVFEPMATKSTDIEETDIQDLFNKRRAIQDQASSKPDNLFNDNNQSNNTSSFGFGMPHTKVNNPLISDNDIDIPAFKRKGVQLESAPQSNASTVSKLTLNKVEEENNSDDNYEVGPNRLLHDNVD